MPQYRVEVLQDGERLVSEARVPAPDMGALWRRIYDVAIESAGPRRLIRVTNAAGGIVVLIGVATALRLAGETLL